MILYSAFPFAITQQNIYIVMTVTTLLSRHVKTLLRVFLGVVGWFCVTLAPSLAAEPPSQGVIGGKTNERERVLERFCLLPEPADTPEITKSIPGAKLTALAPGRETSIRTVRYYTKQEFTALGMGWSGFEKKAAETADRVFATLKPKLTRDARGFVVSAEVRGASHLTASTVLAPQFFEHFRKSMGDELVLLIPDRFTIYVFPRPLGAYQEMGKKILLAYEEAAHPVSYEVLLLNRNGLSALGSFKTDDE